MLTHRFVLMIKSLNMINCLEQALMPHKLYILFLPTPSWVFIRPVRNPAGMVLALFSMFPSKLVSLLSILSHSGSRDMSIFVVQREVSALGLRRVQDSVVLNH